MSHNFDTSSSSSRRSSTSSSSGGGCGTVTIGSLLAGFISYMMGNSIGWILIHAFLSWFYVVYVCFGCAGPPPFSDADIWNKPASDVVEEQLAEEVPEVKELEDE